MGDFHFIISVVESCQRDTLVHGVIFYIVRLSVIEHPSTAIVLRIFIKNQCNKRWLYRVNYDAERWTIYPD